MCCSQADTRIKAQLPPPDKAGTWIIVAHVETPQHWTLVEVCWLTRELRFYDSFSNEDGYARRIEDTARTFLTVCEQIYRCDLSPSAWKWVPEKVSMAICRSPLAFTNNDASAQCGSLTGMTAALSLRQIS